MKRSFATVAAVLAIVGSSSPARAQSSTPGKIAKFADTVNTTVDSVITESGGNIGVGTSVPVTPLSVTGGAGAVANFWRLTFPNITIGQTADPAVVGNKRLQMFNDTTNNVFDIDFFVQGGGGLPLSLNGLTGGNVGIGTTSPTAKLDVAGTVNATAVTSGTVTTGTIATGTVTASGNVSVSGNVTTGTVTTGTVTASGNVNVTGNVTVTGNIAAKYQDVAEWVDSAESLDQATVVVIDPERENHVLASSSANDPHVAGVISSQPGVILGDGGRGRVTVAHSGRVKVKVDAGFGAIRIGDLLTTSPTPGYAMRSQPVDLAGIQLHRPGTILGKALQSLPSGRGEILVLLALQ